MTSEREAIVRGKKHDWYMKDVWGESMPVCERCGCLGNAETYIKGNAVGWRGKPTYGCKRHDHMENTDGQ